MPTTKQSDRQTIEVEEVLAFFRYCPFCGGYKWSLWRHTQLPPAYTYGFVDECNDCGATYAADMPAR